MNGRTYTCHGPDSCLLCCSEASLNSYWVNEEIDKALKKEERLWKERGKRVLALVPIDLDGYLFEWEGDQASILTDRRAPKLVGWETDNSIFETQFEQVVKALRSDPGARPKAPKPKL